MVMSFATGFRSARVLSLYLAAISEVTVTESLSSAAAESSISTDFGSFAFSSALISSVLVAVLFLSTATDSSAPLYSGKTPMPPLTTWS